MGSPVLGPQTLDITWLKKSILQDRDLASCERIFAFENLDLLDALRCDRVVLQVEPGLSARQEKNASFAHGGIGFLGIEVVRRSAW